MGFSDGLIKNEPNMKIQPLRELTMLPEMLKKAKKATTIRCYRNCKFNSFHRSNCGDCQRSSVYITREGCMDFIKPTKEAHG